MPKNEYSRPANLDDLRKIIQSLNEKNAEYILIGGYALFSHGYHRATEDIDLLVPNRAASSKAIIDSLLVLADKESANLEAAWFDEGENIRLADEVVVDLIFKVPDRGSVNPTPSGGQGQVVCLGYAAEL
ncbi:hypothetical protein MNBD_GAMMA19-896 [hydrothermal vent metagenome]|uniref:Uncharacterized protein n=1 Tax=hydrothermal vent metagenome TaxID=652676 RepID=A0A3B1AYG4_9ZZZZ